MSAGEPPLKIQVGLAVNPKKHVYIVRPSDDELLKYLEEGEYCNVLCSRQMGKTSLLHRTRGRLAEKGTQSALIDVAGSLGSVQDADAWYVGLLQMVSGELGLAIDVRTWWSGSAAATPNQRLIQFFREEVAGNAGKRVVIFLDEIDSTLKLPFTDDLFVAIRSMFNDRVREPAYEKLVFCLVGVATPNELIKERRTTPYNVGRTIELRDYDPAQDDLSPLERAVSENPQVGKAVVGAVLRWTGGHPYLTARLCDDFVRKGGRSPADVERLVEEGYSSLRALERDIHFEPVLRFLHERVDDRFSTLRLYQRIWRGRREPDRVAPAQIALKLAGIVKRDTHGQLAVRNPIYSRVFTDRWAQEALPARTRRLHFAGSAAIIAVSAILVVQVFIFWQVNTIIKTPDDYGLALRTHDTLRHIPLYGDRAHDLLAQFYERRAVLAEAREDAEQATVWHLKALCTRPTELRRRLADSLIEKHGYVLETFHGGPVTHVLPQLDFENTSNVAALSPDGSLALTGGLSGIARLWQTSNGSPLGLPLVHGRAVLVVAFSHDGSKFITGSMDNTLTIWRTADQAPVGRPLTYASPIVTAAFSPDDTKILIGTLSNGAFLWSADDPSIMGRRLPHGGPVAAVGFSPDGLRAVTGSADGTARLWSTSNASSIGRTMKHNGGVRLAKFSPDGSRVLTGGDDNSARLWRSSDGSPACAPMTHSGPVLTGAFSPDGTRVATGDMSSTVRSWGAADGSLRWTASQFGPVLSLAFSPDGTRVAVGGADGTGRILSATDGSAASPLMRSVGPVASITYSPDGSSVLAGSLGNESYLWSSVTPSFAVKQEQTVLDLRSVKPITMGPKLGSASITSAATCAKVGRIATGSEDGLAQLWSADDGAPIGQPMRHLKPITGLAFSPDCSRVVTGSLDNTIRLWDAATGAPVVPPVNVMSAVLAVAYSPDGAQLVTGSQDGTVRFWSAIDGSPATGPIIQDNHWVNAVAISADGSKIVTANYNNEVRLWSSEDGTSLGPPLTHPSHVLGVAFNTNGTAIHTATRWWVHTIDIVNLGNSINNTLLPAPFVGFAVGLVAAPEPSPIVAPTTGSIQVLGSGSGGQLSGSGILDLQLPEQWQRRFGLSLTSAGSLDIVR